jgi:hypothetical protein
MTEKTKEFIEKSLKIHGDLYGYEKTEYKNSRTKVVLTCKKHGNFSVLPDNHLRHKNRCAKCVLDNHKLMEISQERLEKIKLIHKDKYQYKDLKVVNGFISIICPKHGTFSQRIYAHEKGHGCNECYLDLKKIQKEEKKRWCKSCRKYEDQSNFNSRFKTCKLCQENPMVLDSKICINCNNKKPIYEFPPRKGQWDGYRNDCIECFSSKGKIRSHKYRKKNKDEIREKNKIYHKNRMMNDIMYRIKVMSRHIIRKSLSKGGYTKRSRTYEILGCSYEEFKIHIENLFMENMNWDNRDLWDIDHIVPISIAESEYEMLILNHYSNLRPLWRIENNYKSDKITLEAESSPIYKEILEGRKLSFNLDTNLL